MRGRTHAGPVGCDGPEEHVPWVPRGHLERIRCRQYEGASDQTFKSLGGPIGLPPRVHPVAGTGT